MKMAVTPARFKMEESFEDVSVALCLAYEANVNSRKIPFQKDKEVWEICISAAKWLTEDKKFGLLFYGAPGNGKTTMTKAICNVINTLYNSSCSSERKSISIVSALDIEKMILNEPLKFEMLKKCPMLCIDDLGMENTKVKSYGNELEPITEILYYRYDRQLFTIANSNLTDEDFAEVYNERIADRLKEMFDRIAFTHKSYRK